MDKENKYYSIIENLVKNNRKFQGYESILDQIIDDVYAHSKSIIDTISDEQIIAAYLEKVVSTSMITVPKKLGIKKEQNKSELEGSIGAGPVNNAKVHTEYIDKMINTAVAGVDFDAEQGSEYFTNEQKEEKIDTDDIVNESFKNVEYTNTQSDDIILDEVAISLEQDNNIVNEYENEGVSVLEEEEEFVADIDLYGSNEQDKVTNTLEEPVEKVEEFSLDGINPTENDEEILSFEDNENDSTETMEYLSSDELLSIDSNGEIIASDDEEMSTESIEELPADEMAQVDDVEEIMAFGEKETSTESIEELPADEMAQVDDVEEIMAFGEEETSTESIEKLPADEMAQVDDVEEIMAFGEEETSTEPIEELPADEMAQVDDVEEIMAFGEEETSTEPIEELPADEIVQVDTNEEIIALDESGEESNELVDGLPLDESFEVEDNFDQSSYLSTNNDEDLFVVENDMEMLEPLAENSNDIIIDELVLENGDNASNINDIEHQSELYSNSEDNFAQNENINSLQDSKSISYDVFEFVPKSTDYSDIKAEIKTKLLDANEKYPEMQILKVFDLKYNKKLGISDIASELSISTENTLKVLNEIVDFV